jgi:hypothetical protein
MRSPRAGLGYACQFMLCAATVILSACTPQPLTQPAPAPTEVPRPSTQPTPRPRGGISYREVEEEFQGLYRADAKTEYAMQGSALAPVEYFPNLDALKAYLRPRIDQLMRYRYPHLSETETDVAHRVPEEVHNVAVDAYIHAVKHESGPRGDRDFHVMLGSSPMPGMGIFLTAEASGLPRGGPHRTALAEARRELLTIIGSCACDNHFMQVSPPIRVRVTGSLFFDGAHGIGSVGPAYAKPFTAWEVHPILRIELLAGAPAPSGAGESAAGTRDESIETAPAIQPKVPEGTPTPTARCRDGTLSYAKSHLGACSGHRGVAEWLH